MATSAHDSIRTIESFIQKIGGSVKAAEAHTEPGSIGGATEHPVKDVDDRTEEAQTGDRASENESDVKEDQGEPGVDSTPEAKAASHALSLLKESVSNCGGMATNKKAMTPGNQTGKKVTKKAEGGAASTPGSAADDQIQQGTNKQPTGEDPANETGSAKKGKEDPGSSHPARTDNDELDGHKYAYANDTPLEKIANDMRALGEQLCTRIYNFTGRYEQPQQGRQPQKTAGDNAAVFGDEHLAYQAGNELAALMNGTMDKAAADRMVHRAFMEIIKTASDDADRYATYMFEAQKQAEAARKQANVTPEMMGAGGAGGMGGDPMAGMGGDPSAMGGGMGGDPSGGGGEDPAALMAALGGGEPAEEGGDPMAGGGAPGAGGEVELTPEIVAQVLQALGISEGDVGAAADEQAAEEGGGDPLGGGAGGAGGDVPPPEQKAAGDRGKKAGSRQGGNKQARDSTVDFFRELIARSRTS